MQEDSSLNRSSEQSEPPRPISEGRDRGAVVELVRDIGQGELDRPETMPGLTRRLAEELVLGPNTSAVTTPQLPDWSDNAGATALPEGRELTVDAPDMSEEARGNAINTGAIPKRLRRRAWAR